MGDRERLLGARLALFYAAYFAAVGIHLPFWPVWLEWRGLDVTEIGYVLAAAFWPRIVTNLLIPSTAERLGETPPPKIQLGPSEPTHTPDNQTRPPPIPLPPKPPQRPR